MSLWEIMNYVAWALCAGIFLWLAVDFIKAEKELANNNKDQ